MYRHTYIARVWINPVSKASKVIRKNISLSALFAPESLISRDMFGSPVPRQPAHLHTQAESGAYLRDSSRFPRWLPFIYSKPPYIRHRVSLEVIGSAIIA